MLDIRKIKEDPEKVKNRLKGRGKDYSQDIDRLLQLDAARRELIVSVERKKAEQNRVSKEIPGIKRAGGDPAPIFEQMRRLSDEIKEDDAGVARADEAIYELLMNIPNLPAERVPAGADSEDNPEIRKSGTPRAFGFAPKSHWELGETLGILDPSAAAKVTGARFHFYRGPGAALERAVISYFLDTHTKNGYTELFPPFLANAASMRGTGQLPKFAEDMFRVEGTDYYLIPTAEVPVTNYHRDEILEGARLPIKYCAYSACFRAEAGSAGRDTRGLIRQHQFNKVELVKFCAPERSYEELESLTNDAERVLAGLGLPYRVVCLCTGDMGFATACTYDVEVWMPSYERYVEISSCSNFEDYQSRRAQIRYKDGPGARAQFVHTLNGSGVAVGRTVACILETYQNEDGTVDIPEALRPYMGGREKIGL